MFISHYIYEIQYILKAYCLPYYPETFPYKLQSNANLEWTFLKWPLIGFGVISILSCCLYLSLEMQVVSDRKTIINNQPPGLFP